MGPVASRARALPPPSYRRLLVPADGGLDADGALQIAQRVAERDGAEVTVLGVIDRLPHPVPVYDVGFVAMPDLAADDVRRRRLFERVDAQLERVGAPARRWRVDLRMGSRAATVTRAARDRRADLVIIGAGCTRQANPALASEDVLELLRLADVPVLVVPVAPVNLPRRAVVAVDFGHSSIAAARATLALLGAGATLHLVHARPPADDLATTDGAGYSHKIEHLFARLRSELAAPAGITVRTHLLRGNPTEEIRAYARTMDAELVAAGVRGHACYGRAILGRFTTELVRRSRCMVLLTPSPLVSSWQGLVKQEATSEVPPTRTTPQAASPDSGGYLPGLCG